MPAAILCYHGCLPDKSAKGGDLHVVEEDLRATVLLLRRWRRVVPLREITRRINDGKSIAGLAALTFDDAYLSVARHARSVLVEMRVPATLFVVSDYAERPRAFWWDRLDSLNTAVSGERWREFGRATGYTDWCERQGRLRGGSEFSAALRDWIVCEHKGELPVSLDAALAELENETGARTDQRAMSWAELDAFRREGEIDVGVHTHTHPALPLLDDDSVRRQIERGWDELRAKHADALPVLAFPYGYHDTRVVECARKLGMRQCLSTSHRTTSGRGSSYVLPRLMLSRAHSAFKVSVLATGLPGAFARGGESADAPALPPCRGSGKAP